MQLSGGGIVGKGPSPVICRVDAQGFFVARSGELIGHGAYQSISKVQQSRARIANNFWEISWGAAEVEVDAETGEVKLLKYVPSPMSGGRSIRCLCEGQDEGGVMNAIGHSLMEEMIYKDGQLLNPNIVDYPMPSFDSLPKDFETILVESHNGPGSVRCEGDGRGRSVAGGRGDRQRVCRGDGTASV